MSKFKVGDKVKVVVNDESNFGCKPVFGEIGTVTVTTGGSVYADYPSKSHWLLNEDDLAFAAKTLDNLEVGDVVLDKFKIEYEVASAHDRIIDLQDIDGDFAETLTVSEMERNGWTVKATEDDTVEMTLDEVAKLKGIDVSKLRIKE